MHWKSLRSSLRCVTRLRPKQATGTCIFKGIKANEGGLGGSDWAVLIWRFSVAGDQGRFVSDHLPSCSLPPACHLAVAVTALSSSRPKQAQLYRRSFILRGRLILRNVTRATTLFDRCSRPREVRSTFLASISPAFTPSPYSPGLRPSMRSCKTILFLRFHSTFSYT